MKKIVITGVTSGIGYELAKIFAAKGWHLILVNRNQEKSDATICELRSKYDNICKIDSYICDLSDVQAIRKTFEQVVLEHPHINALINNAGVLTQNLCVNNKNIDIHFQVNTIASILIGELLRPALKQTGKEMGNSIIINLSSDSIFHTKELNPYRLTDIIKQSKKNPNERERTGYYEENL